MSMKQKIYNTIVVQRKAKTASQLAAQYKTTPATVRARISELRNDGYKIQSVEKMDNRGHCKTIYTM